MYKLVDLSLTYVRRTLIIQQDGANCLNMETIFTCVNDNTYCINTHLLFVPEQWICNDYFNKHCQYWSHSHGTCSTGSRTLACTLLLTRVICYWRIVLVQFVTVLAIEHIGNEKASIYNDHYLLSLFCIWRHLYTHDLLVTVKWMNMFL